MTIPVGTPMNVLAVLVPLKELELPVETGTVGPMMGELLVPLP